MSGSAFPTQTPLNLIMPVKPGQAAALHALLTGVSARPDKPVEEALRRLGNVHKAQFVFLENDTRLGVLRTSGPKPSRSAHGTPCTSTGRSVR